MAFLILLLLWPFAEMALFSQVAAAIGALNTVLFCVGSAVAGFILLQWQGFRTLEGMRETLRGGPVPVENIFDGFCIVAAAMLLILPGFISDIAAMLLFVPSVRRMLRQTILKRFHPSAVDGAGRDGNIIEGEFTRLDERDQGLVHSDPIHDRTAP